MRKILPLALFVCVVALSGCNQFFPTPGHDPNDPMKVVVSSPQDFVLAGGTLQLSVTVTGYGPTTVEWSVNGITGGNSAYGTISSTGLYTAPAAVSADLPVAVTATSLANTSVSATVAILVEAPTITSVAVVCNPASILTTGTSSCSVTVHGTGNYNPAVTWTATNGTITSAGVFTPSAAGNATITATSVLDATRFGSTTVAVAVPPTITSVSVTCLPSSIQVSQTSICTANVSGAGAYDPSITWSVDNGVIDQSGNYKAPASPVTATIRAVSNQDSTKFGTTTVTVNPAPTITGVTMNCSLLVVPVGQTSQCTATVQGTGAFSSDVVWEVNGVEGGGSSIGTISASGLYQAPSTAPNPYVVVVTATSAEDETKSAWVSIRVQGPIDSGTQTIGPAGGTITLADGNSVTIPAGVLQVDTAVTLSSSSVPIQPTNSLFRGIGPSLSLSFNPAPTATGLVQRQRSPLSRAKPLDSSTSSDLTFIVNGDPGSSAAQIQGAFGVANVNNGTNNYYSLPSTYNSALNQTALSFDTNLITAGSTVQIGLSNLYQCPGLSLLDAPKPQIWGTGSFFDAPPNTCATGDRALIMMHGMHSCPNDSFANKGGVSAASEAASPQNQEQYGLDYGSSIYAIEYPWLDHVASSAQKVVPVLTSLVGPNCPNIKFFDIEAHSEGVIVSMAIVGDLDPVTRGKLGHFVSIAGPIDGTPLANSLNNYLTAALNIPNPYVDEIAAGLLTVVDIVDATTFVGDMVPNSGAIKAIKTAIGPDQFAKYDAFAGDATSNPDHWIIYDFTNNLPGVFGGAPNDGVVPVSSALAQGQDTDPSFTSHPTYLHDHIHLVNNICVISDVLAALGGKPSTCEKYTLSSNPSTFSVTAGSGNSFQLTATSTGGFSGTVTISPFNTSGISGSCSPASVSVSSGSPGTSTCSFSTSSSMSAGTYTLNISSTSALPNPVTASITVAVSAPSGTPSYSVSMGGSGQSITAGNSATFSLTATSVNGFSNSVSLPQASMNITGASSSWYPSSISITPSNPGTSTLTVYTSTSTPANTYAITEYMPNGQSAYVLLTVTSSSGGGGGTLSITSTSFNPSTATVGTNYAAIQAMTATGGTQPYTWSASGLPNGMLMNSSTGALYSAPTVSGSFNVTVTVHDSSSPQKTASKMLPLTVVYATPTISYIIPNTFTLGQGGGVVAATITGTGFTTQSYQQYSVSGGAQWAWAQQSPWNISSTSMTIDVNTGTAETQLWRVCAAQVSNPVCSNSVTVTVTIPAPHINTVTSPIPGSTTVLEPITITGTNFSTMAAGGYLVFTDTIGKTYPSTAHPERVASSSTTQWVYDINDNNAKGTWYVQIFNSSGQGSNSVPFTVQ